MPARSRFAQWVSDERGCLHRGRYALVLVAAYLVFIATYVPINLFSVGRDAHVLWLPGEEGIPFLPVFQYLYVLTYLVGPLLWVTVRDWARFRRLLRAAAGALVVAYVTYLVFPVYLERPVLHVDSLHTWLLWLTWHDKSYNHFPSLHVTLSWLAVQASQVSPRARMVLALLTVGVSLSTLFVKQHYLVDVIYGVALAWAAWRLAGDGGDDREGFLRVREPLACPAPQPPPTHSPPRNSRSSC